ncbi:MAG: hypothetical protein OXH08_12105 [Gammaproteobacteria bacterium]|nr:hypothetical protein [Gammaproteobacteria bacterium]
MRLITGKHIPRRIFLKGMGATVALPMLDAMIPAGLGGREAVRAMDATRLIAMEMSHGAAGCTTWGAKQNFWSPSSIGRDFDLSPTSLRTLEPWRRCNGTWSSPSPPW